MAVSWIEKVFHLVPDTTAFSTDDQLTLFSHCSTCSWFAAKVDYGAKAASVDAAAGNGIQILALPSAKS